MNHIAQESSRYQFERLSGVSILVVDDSQIDCRLMRHYLGQEGAKVTVANDGVSAIKHILCAQDNGVSYDIVLMDMMMPVMDGATATRRLRDAGKTIPIVALTGDTTQKDRERCLNAGCDAVAAKPVTRDKLVGAIQQILGRPDSQYGQFGKKMDKPYQTRSPVSGEWHQLVAQFALSLEGSLRLLSSARMAGNADAVRVILHRLKGTASHFGFPAIAEYAASCYGALRQSKSVSDISACLQRLERAIADVITNPAE